MGGPDRAREVDRGVRAAVSIALAVVTACGKEDAPAVPDGGAAVAPSSAGSDAAVAPEAPPAAPANDGLSPHRRPPEDEGRTRPPIDPAERSAWQEAMILGDAFLHSGDLDRARTHYLRALDLDPDAMAAALGALRTMTVKGQGEARRGLRDRIRRKIDALGSRPETAGAARLLSSRLAMAMDEPGEAIEEAWLATRELPELGAAWRVLGEAAMLAERWGQAAEAFQKAAALGLDAEAGTWERLADALDELGELAGAEDAAKRALSLTGTDPHARRRRLELLGVVRKHRGDLDGAEAALKEALALGPDDPSVLHDLAAVAEARGRSEEALALYRRSLEQVMVPMTAWRMGRLLVDLDRRSEALEAFTKAAAHMDRWMWPRSTRWWPAYDLGRLYARAGRRKEAVGWFEDALREARTPRALREVRSWLVFVTSQPGREETKEP